MSIEIYPRIFVGGDADYLNLEKKHIPGRDVDQPTGDWYVLHCCKEPYHRSFIGYTRRGAPKDHPEYLAARRGNRMALNMVDAAKPEFFSVEMIKAGLDFLEEGYKAGKKLLIHCNQGESRGPSVAMLLVFRRILKVTSNDGERTAYAFATFEQAEAEMRNIYPAHNPGEGIRAHLMQYWGEY